MIDKIIKWIESNKWGRKVMREIAMQLSEECDVYYQQKHGRLPTVWDFQYWLDKEGE